MAANINTDSTLTESWNVVDPQELNISEGSDGESIEVIDEEPCYTQQDKEDNLVQQKHEETHYSQQALPQSLEVDKLSAENRDYTDSERDDSYTDENATDSSDESNTGCTREIISDCIYRASHVVIVLFGILIAGIMSTLLLHKVGELALVVVTIKKELGSYKDVGVTDGNVQQELKYQSMKPDNLLNVNDELEQELVNLFLGNVGTTSDYDKAANFEYIHSSKSLESMLLRLMDDEEKKMTSPTIKLLHNISKHLDILYNQGIYNMNIREFTRSWREKLTIINKKMTEDIKKMQLKIVKQIDKNLRNTQRSFFKNMCNKENIKQPECYEKFVKPFEDSDESVADLEEDLKIFDIKEVLSVEKILKTAGKEELKNGDSKAIPVSENIVNQQPCKKKSVEQSHKIKNNERSKVNENGGKFSTCGVRKDTKNVNDKAKPIRIVKHTVIKNSNIVNKEKASNNNKNRKDKKQSQGSNNKNQGDNKRNQRDYEKQAYMKRKKNYESIHINNKGMESDLLQDQNTDTTNSFSSFSKGEFDEEMQNAQETYEAEGKNNIQDDLTHHTGSSWFLRLGNHRSRLRYYRSRGDWLFDRARFRRRWNFT